MEPDRVTRGYKSMHTPDFIVGLLAPQPGLGVHLGQFGVDVNRSSGAQVRHTQVTKHAQTGYLVVCDAR